MITLQASPLDVYGHYRYRVEFEGEVLQTSDPKDVATKLAELGVERPEQLIEHCRFWGVVEIHQAADT